jgi:hypothetical protein
MDYEIKGMTDAGKLMLYQKISMTKQDILF